MKLKSPQLLADISFPDCIYSCSDPECEIHCEEKVKDAHSINIVLTILGVITFCVVMFLLMKTFTCS